MAKSILLTGGGTGGHVYPALAVAEALRQADPDSILFYAGIRGGIEEEISKKKKILFLPVLSAPYPGFGRVLPFLRFLILLGIGTMMGLLHLLRYRPKVVVATGGYVAAPAVFAAMILRNLRLLKVTIFVHEQNIRPGRLNGLVARFADVVGLSFPDSAPFINSSRLLHVGYPVRAELRGGKADGASGGEEGVIEGGTKGEIGEEVPSFLQGIPNTKRIILAFGGSQGARTINRAIVDALPHLQDSQDVFILHGIGRSQRGGYDPMADTTARTEGLIASGALRREGLGDFYRQVEYIDRMGEAYQAASLVVCRGGAGTIKELCAVGRPSLILPKAGLAGDHQVLNALALEDVGAGVVLLEEPTVGAEGLLPAVSGPALATHIQALLGDGARLEQMAQSARKLDDPCALQRILEALEVSGQGGAVVTKDAPSPEADKGGADDKNGNGCTVSSNSWRRFWPFFSPKAAHQIDLVNTPVTQLAQLSPPKLRDHVRSSVAALSNDQLAQLPSRDYLKYRAASMLVEESWQVRNIGVKLVGMLKVIELIPLLKHLFEDTRPASLLARMCGGDCLQNGFIRRNIIDALIRCGHTSQDVEDIVRKGLPDRYYEVRRAACMALKVLGPPICSRTWAVEGAKQALGDHSFEVRMAAIRALEMTTTPTEGLPLLRRFYQDPNWQLRDATLRVFEGWARLGDEEIRCNLRKEMDNFLLTAGGYRPLFGLKETAGRVARLLAAHKEQEKVHQ